MKGRREQTEFPSGHSFRIFRWSQNLREVELLTSAGQTRPFVGEGTHWHYHVALELAFFSAGEGTRFVGDHIGPFAAGDLVLLGEKLPHYWHLQGASAGLAVQWSFPPEHPFWAFPETLPLARLFERAGRGIRYTGRTATALAAGLPPLACAHGAERLGGLLRLLGVMQGAPSSDQTLLSSRSFSLPTQSAHQQAMGEAVRYLLANFRDAVRLEELLGLTRMSKPTFCRQFKKHSGKTFRDFVSHVRLQAACRELVGTDRAILEVALASGFGQLSFFNRIFQRVLGCSPSVYRARKRGQTTGWRHASAKR